MGWPQYTYLALVLLGLGIAIERHGTPKTGNESCGGTFIGTALGMFLLYMGGFFG